MTDPSQYFKGRTVQEQMNEVIGYVDTRAAEVATTAIASDVAQVHQDMLDADADASAAAASAAAAAGTLANAVKKTGEASQSIAGDIAVAGDLNAGGDLSVTGDATAVNIRSTGTLYANNDASVGSNLGVGGTASVVDLIATGNVTVPTPTANNYAANKKYVDDADALKINITDINSYAVGLTGNQSPITGIKEFTSPPIFNTIKNLSVDGVVTSDANDWVCLYKFENISSGTYASIPLYVYRRRNGISSSRSAFGILNFIVGPNNEYANWLICGNDFDPADFKAARVGTTSYLCVKNQNSINYLTRAFAMGDSVGGTFTPVSEIVTDASLITALSSASVSSIITVRT